VVEIWLTNSQKQIPELQNSLKSIFADYKAKKYKTAVFYSGNGELTGNTASLLLRNKAL
jgi:hypothetical protein